MNKVLMVLPHMVGGGAERVASLLMNKLDERGIEVSVVLTSDKAEDVVRSDLKESIPLFLLKETIEKETIIQKIKYIPAKCISKLLCKAYEKTNRLVPSALAYMSFIWQYHREIKCLKDMLRDNPNMSVISFLQPAIPMVLIASLGLPNKIIISERCDPNRLMNHRFGRNFIKKYYGRANVAVFQTEDAKNVYPNCISDKGIIIYNPIKEELPLKYEGVRNKYITTFCRISEQKNLGLLVKAFYKIQKEYPDYRLKIIGNAQNSDDKKAEAYIKKLIIDLDIVEKVEMQPFSVNVHKEIVEDAMYVNSSDYEGMSNAMLEAMAIGMPVICTDCPIGGASTVIEDGINGLLVPVGDDYAMYRAMKKVINDKEFASVLGSNASKIRKEMSLDHIADKWMELL